MPWIQLKIHGTEENAEAIGGMLTANGAQAVTYMDAKDTPIFEPPIGEVQLWHDTLIIGLFDAETKLEKVIQNLQKSKVLGSQFSYKQDQLEDKDWEREWMDNFHPMQFGKRLWICPSWREIPEPDAVNILLDPGLAFGTGTHPTTSLCLSWLDGIDVEGKTVVDFGCGSGILAIAALKLGAKNATGIDIDPQALDASIANAKRNNVADKFEVFLPSNQPTLKADIVIANILAGPLNSLAEIICDYCKPQGHLALSGILPTQAEKLHQHYQQWCVMDEIVEQDNWVRLSGTRI